MYQDKTKTTPEPSIEDWLTAMTEKTEEQRSQEIYQKLQREAVERNPFHVRKY